MDDSVTQQTTRIDHGHAEYTVDELLEQCQGNAASLMLATLRVLADQGTTVDVWAAGVARVFALSWEAEDTWTAAAFLDALLTNLRSLGASVADVELGDSEATATIRDYPDDELAAGLGVDPAFGEAMFHVGVHLAHQMGLRLQWQRRDKVVDLRVAASTGT